MNKYIYIIRDIDDRTIDQIFTQKEFEEKYELYVNKHYTDKWYWDGVSVIKVNTQTGEWQDIDPEVK